MKRLILTLSAAVVGVIFVLVGLPALLRHQNSMPLAQPPAHGLSFVIEAGFPEANRGTNDLARLKEAILRRADKIGVRIYWEAVSDVKVRVMTNLQNPEVGPRLQSALFRRGMLEFRLVHEDSDRLIETGEMPFAHELLQREVLTASGARRNERVIARQKAEAGLSEGAIASAQVVRGNLGEPEIHFTMQPDAASAFARITRDNVGRRLAIVIDGKLYTAPTINSPIETGSGMIVGGFAPEEAFEIASSLDCPLPAQIHVIESKQF